MNYNLNRLAQPERKTPGIAALRGLLGLVANEHKTLLLALGTMVLNSALNLSGPYLIGYAIDHYVATKNFDKVLLFGGILLGIYVVAFFTSFAQTRLMGGVGQRLLLSLRNAIFGKLQEMPIAFFNDNKAGDLISRINNDTDKLNTFFSQSLMQFIGSLMTMTGAGIFLLVINFKLGAAVLVPAVLILVFTWFTSAWVQRRNAANLASTGTLSAEIQESLNNFRVTVVFNRRDYFRQRFAAVNNQNYTTAVKAGLANNLLLPVYSFFSGAAQLIALLYGLHLIATGNFSVGLLVSYLSYTTNFYNPLRQLASLWTSFQVALAGWDRISQILSLQTNLVTMKNLPADGVTDAVVFKNVSFCYEEGKDILRAVNLRLQQGKTYALVGPTGGGKTTTASLIARLYDPTGGTVWLNGRDLRSYTPAERTAAVGFILQDPFLFTGTVKENILYGNEDYQSYSDEQLSETIRQSNLEELLTLFENGLQTQVSSNGEGISVGQKQLIAFMRAVLRKPQILILDEATANVDTVTEELLDDILNKLPAQTIRITIAHRLNTIKNADEIFFVNAGAVTLAGSFEAAVNMLMKGSRVS